MLTMNHEAVCEANHHFKIEAILDGVRVLGRLWVRYWTIERMRAGDSGLQRCRVPRRSQVGRRHVEVPRRSRRQSWVFHAGGRNDLRVVIGKQEDLELAPKTEISGFWEKRRRATRFGASPVLTLDSQENKWLWRSLLSAWGELQNEGISHIRIFFDDFHCLVILLPSQWCNYYRILFFCSWPIEILYSLSLWVIFHFWKVS